MKKFLFLALAVVLVSCGSMLNEIEKNAVKLKSNLDYERRALAAQLIDKHDDTAQSSEWNWNKKAEWNRAKEIVKSARKDAEVDEASKRILELKAELEEKEAKLLEQDVFKDVTVFYAAGIDVKDKPKEDDDEGRRKYFYERYLTLTGTEKDGWTGVFQAKGEETAQEKGVEYGFMLCSEHPKDRFGGWEFRGFDEKSLKNDKKDTKDFFNEEIELSCVNKTQDNLIVSGLTDGLKYRMTLKRKQSGGNAYTLKLEEVK